MDIERSLTYFRYSQGFQADEDIQHTDIFRLFGNKDI